MSGKDNSQYMTCDWSLSGHFELKVNKDRMVINLGRLLSVGSSEKFAFKAQHHKVFKILCEKDGELGQGEVFVVNIENALDDDKLNHPGWIEILTDYVERETPIRTLASMYLQIYVREKYVVCCV